MSKWEFFELNLDGNLTSFAYPKIIPFIKMSLNVAARSKVPNPKFSGYYVKCAGLVMERISGKIVAVATQVKSQTAGGQS